MIKGWGPHRNTNVGVKVCDLGMTLPNLPNNVGLVRSYPNQEIIFEII